MITKYVQLLFCNIDFYIALFYMTLCLARNHDDNICEYILSRMSAPSAYALIAYVGVET